MIRLPKLPENASRFLFVCSLCLFSLLYGVFAGSNEVFPYRQLRDATAAGKALVEVFGDRTEDVSKPDATRPHVKKNTPVNEDFSNRGDEALILVGGGRDYMPTLNPDGGCVAWLMNRNGDIKHFWKYPTSLWNNLQRTSTVPGNSSVDPIGVHLLDDGGLLVSFQGKNTWPFAIGLARLDKDSNIIWSKECHAHHWFTVTDDDQIITPTLRILEKPQPIGNTHARIRGVEGKILEDVLTVMSLDGEVLEEFSMLDAVHDSGLIGLYQGAFEQTTDVDTTDPLHLNFVQLVTEDIASEYQWLNAGDLLVSFRSINSIMILDRKTGLAKWTASGSTLRQHSPIFRSSKSILVLDNHGGDKSLGPTRLAEIGIDSRFARTVFPTQTHKSYAPVSSPSAGHLHLNAQKNRVLMTVSGQNRVLEIDLDSEEVTWEYIHPGDIYTAKYCYGVSFKMNQE